MGRLEGLSFGVQCPISPDGERLLRSFGILAKFDNEFVSIAQAAENGEFALWVGSGISRQAPDLGKLIERAFEYLRQKTIDG